ncbi:MULTISPECIES: L-aspartate oxidase [unclassified Ruegeria]|uniref:L-aspartate oxidase n=1 Tax=unclassified Ruegeria TaxID=2625375 RepID=UPI001489D24D|nr:MULTISPECIES: FAD-binding protein [unclassified Ruegeria]NOD49686.1 FAD-binding protein [Ruegeria sp. HKCCD5849]NOD53960.1 FAD-binding protein [Ruegeria sp. HKCCD5851]NOD68905.1 FAD-binding protein [Ruegeria sp. HKCCD7303]NOE34543.1 FAD-binding protein [Ruegeria sp. HKCCD7318]
MKVSDIERHDTDILILGTGGAGLFAALHAQQTAPEGAKITIAVKGLIGKCGCTRMVQGGYNVALGGGDTVERHFMDTINGGKWLPNQDMAWRLCEQAVIRIRELENEVGCFFDRNADGSLHQKAFAGQTADRTVHKGDLTGIEIINRLMEKVLASGVEKLQEHRAVGLIPTKDSRALAGVLMIDMRTGKFRLVRAKTVMMGTGGGPTMYKYHTPSGDKTMDGLAMALRAGLTLRDMEMVQFHPTGLLAGDHTRMTGTVLEEGLRGAGGQLISHTGQRFMFDYDDRGERATRDVVSRGIYAEMRKNNNPEQEGVFISMAHLGPDNVRKKFKGMVNRCADSGFDLAAGKVEVVPTAHYFMGGVVVDVDTRTEMEGLYVAGEDAGGAHGSNRLGGNGVANSTVYGGIAGDTMGRDVAGMSLRDPDEDVLAAEFERAIYPLSRKPDLVLPLRKQLQNIMWDDVGVMRTEAGMKRGLKGIASVSEALMDVGVEDSNLAFNLTWHDWLNLRSLCDVSEVIAKAGIARENSRGAHFREDYPEPGAMEDSAFTVATLQNGRVAVNNEPVQFTIVRPGETVLPEGAPETLVAAQ